MRRDMWTNFPSIHRPDEPYPEEWPNRHPEHHESPGSSPRIRADRGRRRPGRCPPGRGFPSNPLAGISLAVVAATRSGHRFRPSRARLAPRPSRRRPGRELQSDSPRSRAWHSRVRGPSGRKTRGLDRPPRRTSHHLRTGDRLGPRRNAGQRLRDRRHARTGTSQLHGSVSALGCATRPGVPRPIGSGPLHTDSTQTSSRELARTRFEHNRFRMGPRIEGQICVSQAHPAQRQLGPECRPDAAGKSSATIAASSTNAERVCGRRRSRSTTAPSAKCSSKGTTSTARHRSKKC